MAPLIQSDDVPAVAFRPEHPSFATGGRDGRVQLWEFASLLPAWEKRYATPLSAVSYSPDGRFLAVAGDQKSPAQGLIELLDVSEPSRTYRFGEGIDPVEALAFTPDSHSLAVSYRGNARVELYEVPSGKRLRPPLPHAGTPRQLSFSPDGRKLLAFTPGAVGVLWDLTSGQPLWECRHQGNPILATVLSPDAKVLLTGGKDGIVRSYSAENGQFLKELARTPGTILSLKFHENSQEYYVGDAESHLSVGNLDPEEPPNPLLLHTRSAVQKILPLNCSHRVLTLSQNAYSQFGEIWIWDLSQNKAEVKQAWGLNATKVLYNAPTRTFLTADGNRNLQLWDAVTGRTIGPPRKHPGHITGFDFAPDGASYAVVGEKGYLRIWKTP
jgi:WD40 repeat protein